jgi:undecaprenyl-diphosphatase
MEILNTLQKYDLRLLARIFRQGERRMVIPLARAVSRSGDGYLHILLPLMLWSMQVSGYRDFALLVAVSVVIERALYFTLKNSLKRRRPQEAVPGFRSLITASDKFSFPSGHSSGAFLLATAVVVVYGGPAVVICLWAVSVALSRVILGVHFPGDTAAGALMGSGVALLSAAGLGLL